jgi:hypothetical protein
MIQILRPMVSYETRFELKEPKLVLALFRRGVLGNYDRIETTETRTKISFDTIRDKRLVPVVSQNSETARFRFNRY